MTLERSALAQLTWTRVLAFLREPEALFWTFVFPILLALALGIAFRPQAPEEIAVAVQRETCGAEIAEVLDRSPELRATVMDSVPAARALARGAVALVVRPGDGVPVLIHDPERPEARHARLLALDLIERAAGRRDVLGMTDDARRVRGSRYIDFLLPGLIGLNLLGTGMWGIGFPIATARQQKLLKRLIASPMRRGDYLFSFLLARLVWLLLEVAALLAFAQLAFGIGVTGSWPAFVVLLLVGALAFSALGLLTASRARTIEGVSGLMNAAMLPMWLLSGTFFSAERFPEVLQPLVQALPLTGLNDAARALMNEGAGFAAVAPEIGLLALWAIASFALALRIFRWE